MMIAFHLMAALMALAFPAWDYWEAKRLRTARHPLARTQCYIRCCAVLWLSTFAVMAMMPLQGWWNVPPGLRQLAGAVSSDFMLGVLPALLVALMLPLILAVFSQAMRQKIFAQLAEIDYLLPQTRTEIALFAGVSVTAGICEEVLYRGFLFAYLQSAPWNLDPVTTLLLASAMFGIAHFGQGLKGMLLTGTIGLFLGYLYIATGSLLAPIIVHILIDLRATALCYLRAVTQRQAA
ncbi:CPBP family intramembrane metalloprotease [Massilia sp. RP-1-19]|uniref:CPBP family intramembrane metalloprotease n=1 Tax=Massilia polaris TaxID=2728846 RepID=A0A848HUS3_9BURK|nr:CPBP family intramembrane glutamic endopeptidase [Massilia polaris]NML62458.1 CPBP family intramembrane metalloprotease [Massilia polaris]